MEQTSLYIKLAGDDFALYNLFNRKVDIINKIREQYDLFVKIALVIEMENGRTPEFSRFTSSLDAMIDIDMYV